MRHNSRELNKVNPNNTENDQIVYTKTLTFLTILFFFLFIR